MSCCEPPLGLTYLRGLLARRKDIAVYPSDALEQDQPPDDVYFYRPGEVLVPASQTATFEAAAERIGIRYCPCEPQPREAHRKAAPRPDAGSLGCHPSREVVRFVIASSEDLDLVLTRLEGAAKGLRVSPNHVVFGCPEWGFDPYGEPRPMGNSDLPRLPPVPSDGVVVAVIDSGLPMDCDENPLLATVDPPASEEEPWLYRDRWPVLTFPQGHGSFVTGVVRMRAPAAVVASYRALDDDGVTDEWSLAEQIAVAVEAEPQVINLSLGTTTRHDEPLMGLDALRQATLVGSRPIVVAAAGNLATNRPFYPAADDWVIGVAAVEMTGDPPIPVPASFTNYGDWVDACANGVNLTSAYEAHPYRPISPPAAILHFNGAAQWSGTSFAAPMVAAVVAELRATNPAIDREGVLAELAALGPELPGLGMLVS